MSSLFICPKCGEALERQGSSFYCGNRHCFDIARQGYVNLLQSNQSSEKQKIVLRE